MQVSTGHKWYSDSDLPKLRELAIIHRIFVFQKDLEGALQTELTKKQSKPLKDLEAVVELIESEKLQEKFDELGRFFIRSVPSSTSTRLLNEVLPVPLLHSLIRRCEAPHVAHSEQGIGASNMLLEGTPSEISG